jgi:HK97 family phage prohead protease
MMEPMRTRQAEGRRIESDCYVEGYAVVFDRPYMIFEDYDGNAYYEIIAREAFAGADVRDVIFQYNHGGAVLARMSNGTLGIEADDHGLFVWADLSKTPNARNLFQEIETAMVTKMSWAFVERAWEYDRATRTTKITQVKKVYDVSAVAFPANEDTEISARSWVDGVIAQEKREARARRARALSLKIRIGGRKNG